MRDASDDNIPALEIGDAPAKDAGALLLTDYVAQPGPAPCVAVYTA